MIGLGSLEAGLTAVGVAEAQASVDCAATETCCSSIKVMVRCLPEGAADVSQWLIGQAGDLGDKLVSRGKTLCQYENTLSCKKNANGAKGAKNGGWSDDLIKTRLEKLGK